MESQFPWDSELAEAAAGLSTLTWNHGLPLVARAGIATARKSGVSAMTGDRDWSELPDFGEWINIIR